VTLWQPSDGGHVGFPQGRPPGHVLGLPRAVCDWMAAAAGLPRQARAPSADTLTTEA
jgi:predicted alpha/beta-fold hydrolase